MASKKKPTKRKADPRKAAVKQAAQPSKKEVKAAKKPNVEGRLTSLEAQLRKLTSRIERQFGEDINDDGIVGAAMNKTVLTMGLIALVSVLAINVFAGSRIIYSNPDATGTNVYTWSTDDDGTGDLMITGDLIVSNTLTTVGAVTQTGVATFTADIVANGNFIRGDGVTIVSNVAEVVITAATAREAVVAANLTKIGVRIGTATNRQIVTFSPVFQAVPSVVPTWTDDYIAGATGVTFRVIVASNTVQFIAHTDEATNLTFIAIGNEE